MSTLRDRARDNTVDTRRRLIDAARQLTDEQPLTRVIGASTAEVARRAGVSTGAYFHHFPTAAHLADAVVRAAQVAPVDQHETVEEIVGALEHLDLAEVLRSDLDQTWQILVGDDDITQRLRLQMLLWAHHSQLLHEPDDEFTSVGDVLTASYETIDNASADGWRLLLERTERDIAPPFDPELLSVTLTALLEGLRVRHQLQPERVPDHLFGEAAVALSLAVTVPRGRSRRAPDPHEPLLEGRRSSPQARSGARRRLETRRRIIEAATGRFDTGWEQVSMSEVAEWSGVATQTVVNLFGSVRAVAAITFVRFVDEVRSVVREEPDLPALDGLTRTLTLLSQSAATDPESSRALLEERTATRLHRGDQLGPTDIRIEVPLADSVMYWLVAMPLHGAEPTDVASTLIDFVLSQSLSRPGRDSEIVELAMRLLPRPATALT